MVLDIHVYLWIVLDFKNDLPVIIWLEFGLIRGYGESRIQDQTKMK